MNLVYLLILFLVGLLAPTIPTSGFSFVTKTGNGFERLVVSIDERLAVPPPLSSAAPTVTSSSSGSPAQTGSPTTTGFKGAECQKVLEQLKVQQTVLNLLLHKKPYFFFLSLHTFSLFSNFKFFFSQFDNDNTCAIAHQF